MKLPTKACFLWLAGVGQ